MPSSSSSLSSPSSSMISIVGLSGSGKTTLVVALVERFAKSGLKVATMKHSCHPHPLDAPGKDSHRHKEAGAERVLFVGPGALQLVTDIPIDTEPTPAELSETYLKGMDLIIVEGFIQSETDKIEVVRSGRSERPVSTPEDGLVAVATDVPPDNSTGFGVPVLDLNDLDAIVEFIASHCSLPQSEAITSKAVK